MPTITLTALVAAVMPEMPDMLCEKFEAVLIMEGIRTSDRREIAVGALTWRELPIPLMHDPDDQDMHGGHVVGRIEEITRISLSANTAEIRARGSFDLGCEQGMEASRKVCEQMVRWVSADVEVLSAEYYTEGPDCDTEDGDCDVIQHMLSGRIMGAALVAMPAFPEAVIVPAGVEIPPASPDGRSAVASGAEGSAPCTDCDRPPAEWFADPDFSGPSAVVVTPEGRVSGHVALWGTCHTSYPRECLTPKPSKADYAYFRTGALTLDDNREIAVGQITMDTGHAGLLLDAASSAAHYDHTGTVVADVICGDDEHGIWVAGALRPGATPEQIRSLKAASLSGDWRYIGSGLELVALLAVNVPGFPVPRALAASARVRMDGDRALALIASAGIRASEPSREDPQIADLVAQVAALRRVVEPLRAMSAAVIASRYGQTSTP